MEFHRDRLIDHVHLRVADVAASKGFYQAVLRSLGRDIDGEGDGYFFADELFVDQVDSTPSKVHLAFQANDEATVQQFYQAGLAAGGRDNGRLCRKFFLVTNEVSHSRSVKHLFQRVLRYILLETHCLLC
jgi:catechol 2,3-dioxygenase-like lactoylglutathione lyase family enzyme